MEIEILRNERTGNIVVQVNNARIIYRNFAGRKDKFNNEGDRNFALLIPSEDVADMLINEGFNVKIKPPRDEDDSPFMYLPVKVSYKFRGPSAYLQGVNQTELNEDTIGILDNVDYTHCDMDIVPYDWNNNGRTGRSAYLQGICMYQVADRFRREEM